MDNNKMTVKGRPEFDCCYYNEEDDRACVCLAYNRTCCYQPTCAPNLATTNGVIILILYILFLIWLLVVGIYDATTNQK